MTDPELHAFLTSRSVGETFRLAQGRYFHDGARHIFMSGIDVLDPSGTSEGSYSPEEAYVILTNLR